MACVSCRRKQAHAQVWSSLVSASAPLTTPSLVHLIGPWTVPARALRLLLTTVLAFKRRASPTLVGFRRRRLPFRMLLLLCMRRPSGIADKSAWASFCAVQVSQAFPRHRQHAPLLIVLSCHHCCVAVALPRLRFSAARTRRLRADVRSVLSRSLPSRVLQLVTRASWP